MSARTLRMFLACSIQLEADRTQIELLVGRKNTQWRDKEELFIEVVSSDNFTHAMSPIGSQGAYNNFIRDESGIFVMLFSTKVGEYTNEEFETALQQFQNTGMIKIYTYLKNAYIRTSEANIDDLQSLSNFKAKLKELGHYWASYENAHELTNKFGHELDILAREGGIHSPTEHTRTTPASCFLLMTKNDDFLGRIVRELKCLLGDQCQHKDPQPVGTFQRAHDYEYQRRYNELLSEFFKGPYEWLVTNLPTHQVEQFREESFRAFDHRHEKSCIIIESGQIIPYLWSQWTDKTRRQAPFAVIETDHKKAARQLIYQAAKHNLLSGYPGRMVVLSLSPLDSSANQRTQVYQQFFGSPTYGTYKTLMKEPYRLHEDLGYALSHIDNVRDLDFLSWRLEGFSREDTENAVRRNLRCFVQGVKAKRLVFLCGNDVIAQTIARILGDFRPRWQSSGSGPVIFGFDGSEASAEFEGKGLRILSPEPNLKMICDSVYKFVKGSWVIEEHPSQKVPIQHIIKVDDCFDRVPVDKLDAAHFEQK